MWALLMRIDLCIRLVAGGRRRKGVLRKGRRNKREIREERERERERDGLKGWCGRGCVYVVCVCVVCGDGGVLNFVLKELEAAKEANPLFCL